MGAPPTADAAALRLRRVREALASAGVDALLLVAGADGGDDAGGAAAALRYLLHGASGRALAEGAPAPRVHDETFVVVRPGRVEVHCSPEARDALLPTLGALPGCTVRCPTAEMLDDGEAADAFKVRCFVGAVSGLRRVGVPLSAGGAMEVEQWPIVQAYGAEGVGRSGFFSMSIEVVDVADALQRCYLDLDAHAVRNDCLLRAAPAMSLHWEAVASVGDAAARGGPADVAALTAADLLEPLAFYFDAGTIREPERCAPREGVRDLAEPRAALGVATRALGPLASGASGAVGDDTVGAAGALHVVLEAVAPNSGVRASRSYFFAAGGRASSLVALEGEDDTAVERIGFNASDASYSGADSRRLLSLYAALAGAVADAVRAGEGEDAARRRVGEAVRAAAARVGAQEVGADTNLEVVSSQIDHLNNASPAVAGARRVRFVRAALLDVPSVERAGESLGALVYADSGLAPLCGSHGRATAVCLTDAIPPLRVWRAEGPEARAALDARRVAQALAAGKVKGAPLGALLPGAAGAADDVILLAGESIGHTADVASPLKLAMGSWAAYENGIVWASHSGDVAPFALRFGSDVVRMAVDITGGMAVAVTVDARCAALADSAPINVVLRGGEAGDAPASALLRFSLARLDTPQRRAFVRETLGAWKTAEAFATDGATLVVRSGDAPAAAADDAADGDVDARPQSGRGSPSNEAGARAEAAAEAAEALSELQVPLPAGLALARAFTECVGTSGNTRAKAFAVLTPDKDIESMLDSMDAEEIFGADSSASVADARAVGEDTVAVTAIVGAPGSGALEVARALCAGEHHVIVRADGGAGELESALASAADRARAAAAGRVPRVLCVASPLTSAAAHVRAVETSRACASGALALSSTLLVADASAATSDDVGGLVCSQAMRGFVDCVIVRSSGAVALDGAAMTALRSRVPEARVALGGTGRALADMELLEPSKMALKPARRAFLRSLAVGCGDAGSGVTEQAVGLRCMRCTVLGSLSTDVGAAEEVLEGWRARLVSAYEAFFESDGGFAEVPVDDQPLRLVHLSGVVAAKDGDGEVLFELSASVGAARPRAGARTLEEIEAERLALVPPLPLPSFGGANGAAAGAELVLWHMGGGAAGAQAALHRLVEALRPPAPERPPPVEGLTLTDEEVAEVRTLAACVRVCFVSGVRKETDGKACMGDRKVVAKSASMPLDGWLYDGRQYVSGDDGSTAPRHPAFAAQAASALAAKRAAIELAHAEADAAEAARGRVALTFVAVAGGAT